jgi:hypothetical protein
VIGTWLLFQGASAVQLLHQGFGKGDNHVASFLLFLYLWAAEALWVFLAIYVGLGGNWDEESRVLPSGDAVPIAIMVLVTITVVVMLCQLLYWVRSSLALRVVEQFLF